MCVCVFVCACGCVCVWRLSRLYYCPLAETKMIRTKTLSLYFLFVFLISGLLCSLFFLLLLFSPDSFSIRQCLFSLTVECAAGRVRETSFSFSFFTVSVTVAKKKSRRAIGVKINNMKQEATILRMPATFPVECILAFGPPLLFGGAREMKDSAKQRGVKRRKETGKAVQEILQKRTKQHVGQERGQNERGETKKRRSDRELFRFSIEI